MKRGARERNTWLSKSAKVHVLSLKTLSYCCSSIFLPSGRFEVVEVDVRRQLLLINRAIMNQTGSKRQEAYLHIYDRQCNASWQIKIKGM
ncbi:hypothetical protein BDA96_01G051100 [Sorghum bicolor]|uniref:Uncharacterized protein n=1 Tax=Sorghum bicolor TaxID=4558 RepID=A0A921RWX3_SORBI|nr:hypothetical protein BDA96_01G051100 [Sorghum bicolor]